VDQIKALELTASKALPFPCITLMLARMSIYAVDRMMKKNLANVVSGVLKHKLR